MSAQPTRYTFEVTCEDIGEYDGVWMAKVAGHIVAEIGQLGVDAETGFALRVTRRRPGPFS